MRNVLVKSLGPKSQGAKGPGPKYPVAKRPGAKRPGPKSPGAKSPGPKSPDPKSQGAKGPAKRRVLGSSPTKVIFFSYIFFFLPDSLKNAQILMNVVFFVLIKIEITTRGTFSSIVIELKQTTDNVP